MDSEEGKKQLAHSEQQSLSEITLTNVEEIIAIIFGDENELKIQFRSLEVVLLLIARTLGVLDRKVAVQLDDAGLKGLNVPSYIDISEVKVSTRAPSRSSIFDNILSIDSRIEQSQKKATKTSYGPKRVASMCVSECKMSKPSTKAKEKDSKSSIKKMLDLTCSIKQPLEKGSKDYNNTGVDIKSTVRREFLDQVYNYSDYPETLINYGKSHFTKTTGKNISQGKRKVSFRSLNSNTSESSDVSDKQFMESIIIVEFAKPVITIPDKTPSYDTARNLAPLSFVTRDQFEKLAESVYKIQQKFEASQSDNQWPMDQLHRHVFCSDPVSVLQLSTRLQTIESTTSKIIEVLKSLEGRRIFKTSLARRKMRPIPKSPGELMKLLEKPHKKEIPNNIPASGKNTSKVSASPAGIQKTSKVPVAPAGIPDVALADPISYVNHDQMRSSVKGLYKSLINALLDFRHSRTLKQKNTIDAVKKIERQLNDVNSLEKKMDALETKTIKYVDKINDLDSNYTDKITKYQNEISTMQNTLEAVTEHMMDKIMEMHCDPEVQAKARTLMLQIVRLQDDVQRASLAQQKLKFCEDDMAAHLQAVKQSLEVLDRVKAGRDVFEAIAQKGSLAEFNNYVDKDLFTAQLDAIHIDWDIAFHNFADREHHWEKVLEDLKMYTDMKADKSDLQNLAEDFEKHCGELHRRLDFMLDIVGTDKKLGYRTVVRKDPCTSCSAPAFAIKTMIEKDGKMEEEDANVVTVTEELPEYAAGSQGLCIPHRRLPHPVDSRARFCSRFCGNGGTVVEPENCLFVRPMAWETADQQKTSRNTDGPCAPCNKPSHSAQKQLKKFTMKRPSEENHREHCACDPEDDRYVFKVPVPGFMNIPGVATTFPIHVIECFTEKKS